jgi:hypothetical protein
MDREPSDRSARVRAAVFDEALLKYWESLFDEEDRKLAPYFRMLMLKLYIYHEQNKKMYKMGACRFIPVDHAASAKKYVDLAEQKGWIRFEPETRDKRKIIVEPCQSLLDMIDNYVDKWELTAAELYSAREGNKSKYEEVK